MCIVVDTNVFDAVFSPENKEHNQFYPVKEWIIGKNGKMVFGGTTYRQELFEKCKKYLNLFLELKKAGKTVELNLGRVDALQERIIKKVNNEKFNDPHLMAIIQVGNCCLLCSNDKRADVFIKDKKFYPKGTLPPKIYRAHQHKKLLFGKHISLCNNCLRN